mmetsp:Transcript_50101/g.95705  ORF Transcript_50101/g.95705 Transcript_50101/m.95705 type:complete len:211 (-) Transcript_50101:766-1398(-)
MYQSCANNDRKYHKTLNIRLASKTANPRCWCTVDDSCDELILISTVKSVEAPSRTSRPGIPRYSNTAMFHQTERSPCNMLCLATQTMKRPIRSTPPTRKKSRRFGLAESRLIFSLEARLGFTTAKQLTRVLSCLVFKFATGSASSLAILEVPCGARVGPVCLALHGDAFALKPSLNAHEVLLPQRLSRRDQRLLRALLVRVRKPARLVLA